MEEETPVSFKGRTYFWQLAVIVTAAMTMFLCPPKVDAQGSRVAGSMEGTVMDSSSAVIPGAAVVLRNTSTNQARTAETDAEGTFHVEALAVGTYEVRVDHAGFAPYRRGEIDLTLGETLHLPIVMIPASSTEKITVNAQPEIVDTSQTSVVSSVDRERIEELPVRSRNSLDFVLLAPGVLIAPPAPATSGAAPLTGSGFTFGGLRATSNTISIDGLDNNDEYAGSNRTELSPEIVQEFQVVNNGLSAESGGASGGSINVITRSGTNTVNGDAFIFAQDGAFNARDPFETEQGKPSFQRFRAGFALGGPIFKDKTFYYAAVEQEHNRGEIGSDVDPAVASAINSVLAAGAYPGLATRQITTAFSPIARAETEAAGKLDHRATKNTSLMLRYAFTNNKESG